MAQVKLEYPTRGTNIPTNIVSKELMSPTSDAIVCFTRQKFSASLQGYLINYVLSVSSNYSVYGK